MSRVTCQISVSLDGFVAGPNQTAGDPIGEGGMRLHRWVFDSDENSLDRRIANSVVGDNGAFVMGRNMFGPGRGEWDESWRGWWGEEPPYHAPVFVLTHHERAPLEMEGGTTFHFVTGGIEAALEQARAAAGPKDVSIAGGASTVNQFLAAGHIEELYLHIAPVVLGAGARLFEGVGDLRLEPLETVHSPLTTHVRYRVAA
jgi:dihydrofolate reductase